MAQIVKGGVTIDDASKIENINIQDDHSTGVLALVSAIASEQESAESSALQSVTGNLTMEQVITSEEFRALAKAAARGAGGTISCTANQLAGWYPDEWTAFHAKFPNVSITAVAEWMKFADDEVRKVLALNMYGDETAVVLKSDFAALTSIGTLFKDNTEITSFEEFGMSGVTELKGSVFDGCTNLKSIDMSNITSIRQTDLSTGYFTFRNCSSLEELYCPNLTRILCEVSCPSLKHFFAPKPIQIENQYKNSTGVFCAPQVFFVGSGGINGSLDSSKFTAILVNHATSSKVISGGWQNTLKILDIGGLTDFNYIVGVSMSAFVVRNYEMATCSETGSNSFADHSSKMFVPANVINDYINDSVWGSKVSGKIFSIGSEQWQSTMRSIAETYAPTYNPDFDIENADYSDAYIDYDIFGCDKSKIPYIPFADPEVERVLLANGVGDGTVITKEQLKALTSIKTWFKDNTDIREFNELEVANPITLMSYEFQNCSNLVSIKFPKGSKIQSGVSSMQVFSGCTKLSRINSDEEGTIDLTDFVIGNNSYELCFNNCTSIKRVINSKQRIGNATFKGCTNIEYVKHIGTSFCMCFCGTKLHVAYAPNAVSLEQNGYSKGSFKAQFLPSLQTAGENTMLDQIGKVIDFGKSFSDISGGFDACRCVNLIIRATVVPTNTSKYTFLGTNLFVPSESIDTYKSTWSSFSSKIKPIGGTEWQTEMQSLAAEEGYTLKDGESWADEYIDYKIYGCEPPTE